MTKMERPRVSAQEVTTFASEILGLKLVPAQVAIAKAIIEGRQGAFLSHPFGRTMARHVAASFLAVHRGPLATGEAGNSLRDNFVVGVDLAAKSGDYTAITVARVPGRLRKLLRRIGLDRSIWKYKIEKQEITRRA